MKTTLLFLFLILLPVRAASSLLPASFTAVFSNGSRTEIIGETAAARRRFSPCSTFKIISTLAALDQKNISGPDSILPHPEKPAGLTLLQAFRTSNVPCYRILVSRLDKTGLQHMLDHLDYGNRDLSPWNQNGHHTFWIESSLKISPLEQVRVLQKIFSGSSVFLPAHTAILKTCMRNGTAGQWTVYGKTGTGRGDSGHLEAWFAGFAENSSGKTIYFAAHGADPSRDVVSPEIRTAVFHILSKKTEWKKFSEKTNFFD